MKYAYINGKILDGTKDMQVKEGFVILTDNDKIEDIVKAGTDLNGYEKVDLLSFCVHVYLGTYRL